MFSRERDWANAETAFQRAIELDPLLTQAYTNYWWSTLAPLGKLDEALRILQAALENNPLSLELQRDVGIVHFSAGRYDEAVATFRRVESVEPRFPHLLAYYGRALTYAGRPYEALAVLERIDGRHLGRLQGLAQRPQWLAQAYVLTGNRPNAEALIAQNQDSPSNLAIVYAALGDKDHAFAALERVAVAQPHHIPLMLVNPEFAVLRGDHRFSALRERFGLPPE
jgi:tetratricopeptide (TPR) repeat protein